MRDDVDEETKIRKRRGFRALNEAAGRTKTAALHTKTAGLAGRKGMWRV
jgi:hypothetical protein